MQYDTVRSAKISEILQSPTFFVILRLFLAIFSFCYKLFYNSRQWLILLSWKGKKIVFGLWIQKNVSEYKIIFSIFLYFAFWVLGTQILRPWYKYNFRKYKFLYFVFLYFCIFGTHVFKGSKHGFFDSFGQAKRTWFE